MDKKKIIITGGTGYIGSHICVELIKYYDLIIIDNLNNSKKEVIDKIKEISRKDNISFYNYDLLDKININNIFEKYNPYGVIHLAGLKSVNESVNNPILYYKTNIISTINLVEIMEKNNCFNLIFSSSATVYGNQKSPFKEDLKIGENITNPYGKTKYMIEEILKDLSISNKKWNIVSLRYFNPIGAHKSGLIGENPNDIPNNLMPFLLKVAVNNNTKQSYSKNFDILNIFGDTYKTKDGTCERDFIHVIDLALGHLKALQSIENLNNYNVFNLGTGKSTSVLELINIFKKVNNIDLPYKIVSKREGDLDISYCETEYTYKKLNWKTLYNIEDMCKDSWNYQILNLP